MTFIIRLRKRAKKSYDWLRGWFHAHVTLPWICLTRRPIRDLSLFRRRLPFIERREFSQNGEDGMIAAIFAKIGMTNKYCVEFGVEDGLQCNCRYLLKHKGWTGLLMDGGEWPTTDPGQGYSLPGNHTLRVKQEFVTAENIEELFRKYDVPSEFDLLSIDIDGNDYWVWKAITHYRSRVVIIEYNANKGPDVSVTVPYAADFAWDKTDYQGASLRALEKLGNEKGYVLVGTDRCGVNAFFVAQELAAGNFDPPPFAQIFHPPAYKGIAGKGHPSDSRGRPWVSI